MKGSITLHPTHGVNPTIGKCFFCGEDTGELALLGFNQGKEAPKYSILSYTPCKPCQDRMTQGITLIECTEWSEQGRPAIQEGAYPTGRWWVITEEGAARIFGDTPTYPQVQAKRRAFITPEAAKQIRLYEEST